MSDAPNTPEQPPTEAPSDPPKPDDIPAEVLRKQVTDANAEAAKYRTKLRESEAEVTRLRTAYEPSPLEQLATDHKLNDKARRLLSALEKAGHTPEELAEHAATLAPSEPRFRQVPDEPRGGLNPAQRSAGSDDARARVRKLREGRI